LTHTVHIGLAAVAINTQNTIRVDYCCPSALTITTVTVSHLISLLTTSLI